MYLQSIASATPPHAYTQTECWEAIKSSSAAPNLKPRSLKLLEKVLTSDSGIDRRQLSLADPSLAFDRDAGELNHQFESFAPGLSSEALEKALHKIDLKADELDALFICTCTGYLCPGVTSHVAEQLGCRPDTFLQDIVGLGCGAAIPTLRAADAFLAANPGATVATIAVEICSAAFYINDDPGVLISLCLFGDAASASIWRAEGKPDQWQASGWQTLHQPQHREKIRFVNDGGMLKNQLHRSVPNLSSETVSQLYSERPNQIQEPHILAHTGGRDVIDAIESKLGLTGDRALTETRQVLKDYGNCSSPCVLLALEHYTGQHDHLWLTAFGAGFAAHACSLRRG